MQRIKQNLHMLIPEGLQMQWVTYVKKPSLLSSTKTKLRMYSLPVKSAVCSSDNLVPLYQNYILTADLGKIISRATAYDTAADDDDFCFEWKRIGGGVNGDEVKW